MKKTVIALIVVLPLLFVLVVFSAGNAASLSVVVSANGIAIKNKPEYDTLSVDLASYQNDYQLEVEVTPVNASNKGYSFRIEDVEGSERAGITVSDDGVISATSTGVARVVVESNDGGYTDSLSVVVGSSKPTDVQFMLSKFEDDADLLEGGTEVELDTGRYFYRTRVLPTALMPAKVEVVSGTGILEEEAGAILLPFSGETVLQITVEGGLKGDIVKTVRLRAARRATASGFTVNGTSGVTLVVEREARNASFYVEADAIPTVSGRYIVDGETRIEEVAAGCYRVTVGLAENRPSYVEEFDVTVSAGGKTEVVTISFADFAFTLRSDLPVASGDRAVVLKDRTIMFYASPAVIAEGITYRWSVGSASVALEPNETGSRCAVTVSEYGEFKLEVRAYQNGRLMDLLPVEVTLDVIREITAVRITNETAMGLGRLVVAGYRYEGGSRVTNEYALNVVTYNVDAVVDGGLEDLEFTSSDPTIATVEFRGGYVWLKPVAGGKGEVTITASWQGNRSFNGAASAAVTLYVAGSAVEVKTSAQIVEATERGYAVVLGSDIMLGTDDNGEVLPLETRTAMLHRMRSTYNIDYYLLNNKENEAYVNYLLEFKNDVYGNGYSLDAGAITNALDGTGNPEIFKGPIYFVNYKSMASVAGQDNIAYLVRTNGVTLYNVNLLGCSDSALLADDGQYDLTKLDNVGTVLEVNASINIINCRVRNGRNVIRVYGGNRNGYNYFIDSLADNAGCDEERITVTIEGSIISQGREFLVKEGANRALRASAAAGGQEPALLDEQGKAYPTKTNRFYDDPYFYKQYVMTDLTVKDSVLETSGFFSIGIESNFSGVMLYKDATDDGGITMAENWKGTGGTSFASVLRLEGDVRLYDWKDLGLVDSSTLINSATPMFQLNVKGMLEFVCAAHPDEYGNLMLQQDGKNYVHGGIAYYGGGKNYAQLSVTGLNEELKDFTEYLVNISILADSDDETIQMQGQALPGAAGTEDFRFYLYDTQSPNSYAKQMADAENGRKYTGVTARRPF